MSARILVIEDQEQNLYLVTYILERRGHRVIAARDGRTGVSIARSAVPDLILLDIQLPTMTGYEVAEALRSESALSHVPIIAVTSYAMPGDREQAMAAGCAGYIEKPIDPDTFAGEVEAYLTPEGEAE